MKAFIKYISLLIVSGLILTFYYSAKNSNNRKRPHEYSGSQTFNQVLKVTPAPHGPKDSFAREDLQASVGFSIFEDIARKLFPILKSLN